MRRTRFGIVVGLAIVALAGTGCGGDDGGSAGTDTTDTDTVTLPVEPNALTASVGPGFEISLTDSGGTDVETLAAGSYTVEVDDQSSIHNFHLTGPGVDEQTTVSEEGTATWNVTVEAGTYTFVCDPHASSMAGSFEVS